MLQSKASSGALANTDVRQAADVLVINATFGVKGLCGSGMQWWLTVFFLLGNSWISGDHVDGWGSRAYATAEECEARKRFAELQTDRFPLELKARWICSKDQPAAKPPPAALNTGWENNPWPMEAQWNEEPRQTGLEVFTRENVSWMAPDGVGLRYTGPLRPPLADALRKLLLTHPLRFDHVVLELDSNGGELSYVKQLVSVLKEVRGRMELTTRVMEGALCASGCIPVFMQGEKRKASGASVWVFHGARSALTNIPDPAATEDYLAMLTSSGLQPGFRAVLEAENRIYRPGSLILSGYEVLHQYEAGIITELLPSWREEEPRLPPAMTPRR
jgi:hypothetical protein